VPEQPLGEMKNGLRCDRLSSSGFCANAFRLLTHALAYAIVVLFREAVADVPEVATASVATLRQRLWKVGAVVVTSARRVLIHVSSTWRYQDVWQRVHGSVTRYVARWCRGVAPPLAAAVLGM
jgi:DDE family transposase